MSWKGGWKGRESTVNTVRREGEKVKLNFLRKSYPKIHQVALIGYWKVGTDRRTGVTELGGRID